MIKEDTKSGLSFKTATDPNRTMISKCDKIIDMCNDHHKVLMNLKNDKEEYIKLHKDIRKINDDNDKLK